MLISSVGKNYGNFALKFNTNIKKQNNNQAQYKLNTLSKDTVSFGTNKAVENKISIIPASNPNRLEKNILKKLDIEATPTEVKKFANSEIYVNINGKVRGKDVYLMPSSGLNVNDNLMETYLKADAAKRAGAKHVIAVLPSFDYARQERKVKDGEPIAARLNMDLLKTSGVDEIITTDLHAPAIEGFASHDMPVIHLKSMPLMKDYLKSKNIDTMVIVSPDLGGTKRVESLADALGCEKATIHKHREKHNEAKAIDLIGDVQGKNCVIYDDMIDTAGTIVEAARMLKERGAEDIYVCATHGLYNGPAIKRLNDAPIKEVISTNTLPEKRGTITNPKFKQIDISGQITEAIKDISQLEE